MGSKSAAKTLMERAGVPLVPGYHGDAQDLPTLARRRAHRLSGADQGLAGGGGKGMRIVERAGGSGARSRVRSARRWRRSATIRC
jgi:3-methylcrotonyl-CoA carboxylase alpha subunit